MEKTYSMLKKKKKLQPYYYKTSRFQYKNCQKRKRKALCIDEGINPTGRCVCIIKGYAPNARAHNLFKTNANKSKEKKQTRYNDNGGLQTAIRKKLFYTRNKKMN